MPCCGTFQNAVIHLFPAYLPQCAKVLRYNCLVTSSDYYTISYALAVLESLLCRCWCQFAATVRLNQTQLILICTNLILLFTRHNLLCWIVSPPCLICKLNSDPLCDVKSLFLLLLFNIMQKLCCEAVPPVVIWSLAILLITYDVKCE